MRALLLTAMLVCATATPAHARDVSVGVSLSYPEIAGAWLSFWPASTFTVDARLTLQTFDAGFTGHIPLAGSWDTGWRHDLIINAMAGYVHGAVATGHALTYNGMRFIGDVGYGMVGPWDFRATVGISGEQTGEDSWGTMVTAMAVFAKTF